MQIKTAFVLLAALASSSAMGCSSSENGGHATGVTRASLHRAKSCGDLLGDLEADASFKLNKAIDYQIKAIHACQQKYGDAQCAGFGGYSYGSAGIAESAADSRGASAPTAQPSAASGTGSDVGKEATNSASSYSETNTQVKGVDEADIVKNDGKNLYILHGRTLKVVNAWPATDLKEASSIEIEGQPSEMFVADGNAVVYSTVNGASIFAAAGVTPKTQYQDFGYGKVVPVQSTNVSGSGAATSPSDPKPIAVDAGSPDSPGNAEDGGAGSSSSPPPDEGDPNEAKPSDTVEAQPYVPLTKVTVIALGGATPTVTREVYFEGSYLDSRRVGPHIRTVFQGYPYGPQFDYAYGDSASAYPTTGTQAIAALETVRAKNLAIIHASQVTDWLPYTFVKNGATVSAQTAACEDFYVPTTGSTESGITTVSSLDLSAPASPPKETVILGRADTVYGNADTLYLAAQAWVEPPFAWPADDAPVTSGVSEPPTAAATPSSPPADSASTKSLRPLASPPTSNVIVSSANLTHVHKFEFASQPDFPNYVASGTVAGSVKNQFSLDDKDGFLRIATTENRQYVTSDGYYVQADFTAPTNGAPAPVRPNTVNHLFVLEQHGPWLDLAGDVGELAPNEQIYSVRFVEHRGYVVTFRQVDPLFVVDLTTPTTPHVLAALKIPGFSEYMHPLDANHLLTIGRDASSTGQANGLQLQIFDVTDGANPIVQHKFTYSGQEYGFSDAEYDHKAFTYFDEKKLLAFPFYSYATSSGDMRSSLELFRIDLGTGFTKVGSIDHTPLVEKNPGGFCGGYYGPSVRRGVFLENFVYSISYGGVVVKDANDLAAAGKELVLPAPQNNDGYGPVCY